MSELKPCPCCDSHASLETTDCDELGDCLFWVECFACGIRTGISDIDNVYEVWNRRAGDETDDISQE